MLEVDDIRVIDPHEHIGSICSVGMSPREAPVVFVADTHVGAEARETDLFDLLLSPYLVGLLRLVGFDEKSSAVESGYRSFHDMKRKEPERAFTHILPYLRGIRATGNYQAVSVGLRELYGFSLDEVNCGNLKEISSRIKEKYDHGMLRWCREVFGLTNVEKAVKPVWPTYMAEYCSSRSDSAEIERQIFRPILRVDFLLREWIGHKYVWKETQKSYGSCPDDIEEYLGFIDNVIMREVTAKTCGLKQFCAYYRPLSFKETPREELQKPEGIRQDEGKRRFDDFVMHHILSRANDLSLPFQIHTGTTNMPGSNPVNLQNLFPKYPDVKFVLLHCFPFLRESALLARNHENVYLDACWLGLLSPQILESALREWIGFVPESKILISGDSTNVEEFCGTIRLMRQGLSNVLSEKIEKKYISRGRANEIAELLLRENAKTIYRNL